MNENKIEDKFFHSYDLKKVFDEVVKSKEFNLLPTDRQLKIIEKLNFYTREVLLPTDFRERYNNIEGVLFGSDKDRINSSIMKQLNSEDLFFLNYIGQDN